MRILMMMRCPFLLVQKDGMLCKVSQNVPPRRNWRPLLWNATANTLNTTVTTTEIIPDGTNHNEVNEGWPLTSTGAPETFPYGVENISFDLSQYNNAPSFHWPESSSRSQLQ